MILLYPWVLMGFPIYLICRRICQEKIKQIFFPNFAMLKSAAGKTKDIEKILQIIIVFLMLLALSSPVQTHSTTKSYGIGHDIALLLDASDSMRDDKRFEIAKGITSDFVRSRDGDRLALGVFADYAYLSVPLTTHTDALNTILTHLPIGVAGKRHTALYEALYLGSTMFGESTAKHKVIILLTDGLNTVQSIPLKLAIEQVKQKNIKVYTIGIGDDYRKSILQDIAQHTDGRFYEAKNPQALQSIYADINRLEKSEFCTQVITYNTPLFRYPLMMALALMVYLLYLLHRQNSIIYRHYISLLLLSVALYGPYKFESMTHTTEPSSSIMIAIDISYSMSSRDTLPSRLQIAYHRAKTLIDELSSSEIGLISFGKQSYLITPPTKEHANLKILLDHMDISHIHRKGSNILSLLQGVELLLPKQGYRDVVLLSDGGEMRDFSTEIQYAKSKKIRVYIYAIGTTKGGVIEYKHTMLKDKSGNIIISRLNPAIKQLAEQTGGYYIEHSASNTPLQTLVKRVKSNQTNDKSVADNIEQKNELYYIPLLLALLLFASTHIGFRRVS